MFCSRQSNNLINQIRKRSQKTSYQNLLKAHNRATIHQRILQVLITEIYKIVNGVVLAIMNSLLEFRNNEYDIRNFQVLSTDFRRTLNHGISYSYLLRTIPAKIPSECKLAASLEEFKVKIKK